MKTRILFLPLLVIAGLNSNAKVVLNYHHEVRFPMDTTFDLVSLMADAVDLNDSTGPAEVDPSISIVASFSTNADETTANNSNIILYRDYDGDTIETEITTSGNTITIDPVNQLGSGIVYHLQIGSGVMGINGTSFVGDEWIFTTTGLFAPDGQIAFWDFEGNTNDQIGGNVASAEIDTSYADGIIGKALSFNGTTTIVEFPNGDLLMNTNDFSLSFWVKASSLNHDGRGHFVLGLGVYRGFQFEIPSDYSWCKLAASYEVADSNTFSSDLFFLGDGLANNNGGWQGWTFCKDLTNSGGVSALLKDIWAHVVCVYNSSTREGKMYINGELMKTQDFNLWPANDPLTEAVGLKYSGQEPEEVNEFALGFFQSRAGTLFDSETWGNYDSPAANHFEGLLDNLRIFHSALSDTEVSMMYGAESGVATGIPSLPGANTMTEVYPNPFASFTTISFSAIQNSRVLINLYDLSGKLMQIIMNENISAGNHKIMLERGCLTRGIYLLKFQLNDEVMIKKVVIE